MLRRALGLCLALCAGLLAMPASALVLSVPAVQIDLTISFAPEPPPIIPADALLSGLAIFYKDFGPFSDFRPSAIPPIPIGIGDLARGGSFHFAFSPPDPCFGAGLCRLDFSFAGLTGDFATFAFLSTDVLPGAAPNPPPILPIGTLDFASGPNPPPIDVLGNIVAFDDPVIVGTFEVRLSVVPEPSSALLLAAALATLALRRRRAKFPLARA